MGQLEEPVAWQVYAMGSMTSVVHRSGSEDSEELAGVRSHASSQQALPFYLSGVEDILLALGESESDQEQSLYALRGEAARFLIEDIQMWLDAHPHHRLRRQMHRILLHLSTETKEIPRSLFVKGVRIESRDPTLFGAYADVFRGSWDGKLVALKRLRINACGEAKEDLRKRFCKEGLTWRQLQHPNIVPFYGIDGETFRDSSTLAMVSPWMKRGTIMKHICSKDYNARRDRHRLMTEVAEGLNYLHQRLIAHGDLHGNNVLITDDGRACLTDFGLTVIGDLSRPQLTSKNMGGAWHWISPEQISDDPRVARKRPAGDVFAFGRLCLAICIKQSPFQGKSDMAVLFSLVQDERPPRPSAEECPDHPISDELWRLVNECWVMDPTKRPSTSSVLSILHRMAS